MEAKRVTKPGIAKKLFAYFLAIALAPIPIGGIISFYISKNECEKFFYGQNRLSVLYRAR